MKAKCTHLYVSWVSARSVSDGLVKEVVHTAVKSCVLESNVHFWSCACFVSVSTLHAVFWMVLAVTLCWDAASLGHD